MLKDLIYNQDKINKLKSIDKYILAYELLEQVQADQIKSEEEENTLRQDLKSDKQFLKDFSNYVKNLLNDLQQKIDSIKNLLKEEQRQKEAEQQAKLFIKAIKTLASKPNNLDNFESYLSQHFYQWLEKFANTPEAITFELTSFANMEI